MSNQLQAFSQFQMGWQYQNTQAGFSDTGNQSQITKKIEYTTGTGADQADAVFAELGTLAPSEITTFDLTSVTDLLNQSISFTKVKSVMLWCLKPSDNDLGTTASSIQLGGAAANPALEGATGFWSAGATQRVWNGGFTSAGRPDAAGAPISGSAKNLKLVNNDSVLPAAYYLVIIGSNT